MEADLAAVAALIADPSRAAMLNALFGGEPVTAGELARRAGIAPSTATGHLRAARGGRARRERPRDGRTRRVRLAGPEVARRARGAGRDRPAGAPARLQATGSTARRCAARAPATTTSRASPASRWPTRSSRAACWSPARAAFAITARGEDELAAFGLDVPAIHGARRATARACLDWSERRPHVAGALGAALLDELLRRRWLRRRTGRPGAHR